MRKLGTDDDVRALVERRLRHPVIDAVWRLLQEDGYVAEVLDASCDADLKEAIDVALKRIRKLEDIPRPSVRSEAVQTKPKGAAGHRTAVVSALRAWEARCLPEVQAFRAEELGGTLLEPEAVRGWLEGRARWDARPRTAWLAYPHDDGWEGSVPAGNGALKRLKGLADALAERFDWSEPAAVRFVLADVEPLAAGIAGTIHVQSDPTRNTISLRIPTWVSAEEVAAAYCSLRRDAYARGAREQAHTDPPTLRSDAYKKGGARELRGMNERNAAFVLFVTRRLDDSGKSRPVGGWRAAHVAWNDAYPQWAFSTPQRMASDFARIRRTVVPQAMTGRLKVTTKRSADGSP
ncbi:hypothetical protein FJZ36_08815 [Candidatus Poribacteria bacterium]|nr:hypothetical protein [Candidatus Poribacteria bacterium]